MIGFYGISGRNVVVFFVCNFEPLSKMLAARNVMKCAARKDWHLAFGISRSNMMSRTRKILGVICQNGGRPTGVFRTGILCCKWIFFLKPVCASLYLWPAIGIDEESFAKKRMLSDEVCFPVTWVIHVSHEANRDLGALGKDLKSASRCHEGQINIRYPIDR